MKPIIKIVLSERASHWVHVIFRSNPFLSVVSVRCYSNSTAMLKKERKKEGRTALLFQQAD